MQRPSARSYMYYIGALMVLMFGAAAYLLWLIVAPPPVASGRPGTGRGICATSLLADCCDETIPCGPDDVCFQNRCVAQGALPECVEGGEPECPSGKACLEGKCVMWPGVCRAGAPCAGCVCSAPLSCQDGLCRPDAAPVCSKPEIRKALSRLHAECAKRRDGKKLTDCQASDWKSIAISDAAFDLLMASFPDLWSLHFPPGEPRSASWPNPNTREHYLSEIRKRDHALATAKTIFIIGRASKSGSRQVNEELALRRMNFVTELLHAEFNTATDPDQPGRLLHSPDEQSRLGDRLATFSVGQSRQLDGAFFFQHYADAFVTWDEVSSQRLLAAHDAASPPRSETEWAGRTINQTVLVVPMPCE